MSSSTFKAESCDDKDDQLIIIVNADGTITVDPETLEKLIANKHHGNNLSIVRVGEGSSNEEGEDDDGTHINLTVEGYFSENDGPTVSDVASEEKASEELDPFSPMEPEHIARLESVLESEHAKELLEANLEDNLNSIIVEDVLGNKDDITRAVVHNDHSYTTPLPAPSVPNQIPTQKQIFQQQGQTVTVHRPLTRGGRGRGRGRVLTRGGSSNRGTANQVVTVSSSPVVIQQNLTPTVVQTSPQKTYLITQAGHRVITQPTTVCIQPCSADSPAEKVEQEPLKEPQISSQPVLGTAIPRFTKIIQRKLIPIKSPQQSASPATPQLKQQTLQQVLMTSPSSTPIVTSPENGRTPIVVRTNSQPVIIQKKVITLRGGLRGGSRGGRGGRGGRGRPNSSATTPPPAPSIPVQSTPTTPPDDVSNALQAMEISPPSVTSPPQSAKPTKQVTTPVSKVELPEAPEPQRRRTPTVIIRKVGSRSEIVPQPLTKINKLKQVDEIAEQFAPPLQQQDSAAKTSKQALSTKSPETVAPSSRGQIKETAAVPTVEESVKKKKEKKNVAAPVIVEGPELFSAPDIIRRVSIDKIATPEPPLTPQTPSATPESKIPEPKVEVQPAHPPLKSPIGNRDMTPESILDSIHAEIAEIEKTNRPLEAHNESQSLSSYPGKQEVFKTLQSPEQMLHSPPHKPEFPETPRTSVVTSDPKVRKLPPIELPTTRSASKKAAATTDQQSPRQKLPQKEHLQQSQIQTPVSTKAEGHRGRKQSSAVAVREKRHSNETRRTVDKKHSINDDFVSDFEDEMESEAESINSEDDPNRLWCICKKPHNNRFMICCDGCEDWFHGKCVGVTKAMGRQMEMDGTEWSCPDCRAKEDKFKTQDQKSPASAKLPSGQQTISSLQCLTCKRPARVGSNYCQDACVTRHALNMIGVLNSEVEGLQPSTRVIVYERKSGRIISDDSAPRISNLAEWLLAHQTFEVHKLSINPSNYKHLVSSQVSPTQSKRQSRNQQTDSKVTHVQLKQQQLPVVKRAQASKEQLSLGQPKQQTPKQSEQHATTTKQVQQVQKQQVESVKVLPATNKANGSDKALKQTLLTSKVVGNTKEISFSPKPAPAPKIQLIQAQPLPPAQPAKTKSKKEEQIREEEEKNKKPTKTIISSEPPTKRTSSETKKQSTEKPVARDSKRRDSISSKETTEKEDKSKKEEKKKEKKKDSGDNKLEETSNPFKVAPPEDIRTIVKRNLQLLLSQRVKEDKTISITDDEISELVTSIEEEMYEFFKGTGYKYKNRSRSIQFNIKDSKNTTLYKKIVEKSITPKELVTLPPEALADEELTKWRKQEELHQLEIIKKNELDLIQQSKTVVLKSRKGEEVIESKTVNISEIESALNRTADDYEEAEPVASTTMTDEEERLFLERYLNEQIPKEDCQSKSREKNQSTDEKVSKHERSSSSSRKRSRSRSQDPPKNKRKKDIESEKSNQESSSDRDKEETLKMLQEVISQHAKNTICIDKDPSDKDPSSTISIGTPPLESQTPIWQGTLFMQDVAKMFTSAYEVSGSCEDLGEQLPDQLTCIGRIQPISVWEYISRMKKAGTKDIIVIRFHSDGLDDNLGYLALYSYLNSRNRMAVVGNQPTTAFKDFYVLPLPSHSPVPQVLLPIDGPGFDEFRPNLLLGIIVRSKKIKKPNAVSSTCDSVERSYTPPLPDNTFSEGNYFDADLPDSGSSTPPQLPPYNLLPQSSGFTPTADDDDNDDDDVDDDEPYSPGEDYSPDDSRADNILVNPDIQRNIEEVDLLIEQKRQQIKHIAQAAVQGSVSADEEAPYSPSSSLTPPHDISYHISNDIRLPHNLQNILTTFPGAPAMDVNSDPIVKAYTSHGMLYEEEDEIGDEDRDFRSERSSRDPRQRPEPRIRRSSLSHYSEQEVVRNSIEMDLDNKNDSFKPPFYYPAPPPPPPPVAVSVVVPPIYAALPPPPPPPPPPPHYKYTLPVPAPLPPPPIKDRKRKEKFKDRRPPHPLNTHPSSHQKWDGGHHRGHMMPSHLPPMHGRQMRFRGNFDRGRARGGFRGRGSFRHHRGGGHPPSRFNRPLHGRDRNDRNVQSEWDEEIRKFEQRRQRERKRKVSRSPSPHRRSGSPVRRRSRRASSHSS